MRNKEKKKDVIILVLCIIVSILIIGIIVFFTANNFLNSTSIDCSAMSSSELLETFKQEGYEIKIYESGSSTVYVNLVNTKEGITLQRIYNTYLGNLMTFDDNSINDQMADLIDTSENDTPLKQQQYEAFENWLKKYNITKSQISEMLDTYYEKNKNNAIDLDATINDLLNK